MVCVQKIPNRTAAPARCEAFQAYLKELDLYPLPFPTLLAFAVIELDVLHALYQLYHLALFQSGLVEPLDVKLPPIAHKERNPCHIQSIAHKENGQHHHVIIGQNTQIYNEIHYRKHDTHAVAQQKVLYPPMVTYALQDVARHAGIEKLQGHGRKFDQEIGYQRNVDTRIHVQHNPRTDVVDAQRGHEKPQLRQKYQGDDIQIAPIDALIHHRLRKERDDDLYSLCTKPVDNLYGS